MPQFEIKWLDPETDEMQQGVYTFHDTPSGISHNGHRVLRQYPAMSARTWAEDFAYEKADKGWYQIREL